LRRPIREFAALMPCLRRPSSLALIFLAAAVPLAAQLPPITVPKGLLRLDFGGRFDNWDQRYLNGVKQDAASDFNRDPVDGLWLPSLGQAEGKLRAVTGVNALSLSLGRSTSTMLVSVGTGSIGVAYGVTRRLTLFGTVPIVRVRVQPTLQLDSTGATAGFNPANPLFGTRAGAAQTGVFRSQLAAALTTLGQRLSAGAYDSDPARKAMAQAILATGNDLDELLANANFLPLTGTPAAAALTSSIETLRTGLISTDTTIRQVVGLPALPGARIGTPEFDDFVTNSAGPIAAQPLTTPVHSYLGDIEVGAAYAWLDHRPAAGGGLAVRSVLQGLVRLPTGKLDLPDTFFDLSTGDRQLDVQGDLVTDLVFGKLGARLTGRYVLQVPGRQDRRVAPLDQPIALAASLAGVQRDPGEIVEGSFEPFVRIGPTLSLVAGVRYWSKQADTYTYAPNQAPIENVDISVLGQDSKENGTALSAGLSFVHSGVRRDGSAGLPMDAALRWEMISGSTLGRVPAKQTVSMVLRLYHTLF
jgi:hypothetical protein